MDIAKLIANEEARRNAAQSRYDAAALEQRTLLDEAGETLDEAASARFDELTTEKRAAAADLDAAQAKVTDLRKQQEDDERLARGAEERNKNADKPAPAHTTERGRTYNEESDRRGVQFASDVASAFLGDSQAAMRLDRHMQEERDARGGEFKERSVGTGAFSGIVVPQYLTQYATPLARAGRPLADAMNPHDLPPEGMTVYLPRSTTGTSAADQANEFDTVSETDYDDTLLAIPVRTAAGSQTISRQALERGVGVEDTIMQDLEGALDVNLDSGLINKATVGLSAVANAIAYTDASPTAVELYPKLLQGPAQVEAALLNAAVGDAIAVMHSRRWYWLQSQLTSTFPLFGQPGVAGNAAGVNYGEVYGRGFRGLLPSGVPVIVDNNIATNLGAGTNEDEVYFTAQSESHLWEDPNAPRLIRAEQSQAKKLAVDLVLYSYYAFTFVRRPHAQKIGGTGLVTPAFT